MLNMSMKVIHVRQSKLLQFLTMRRHFDKENSKEYIYSFKGKSGGN